jgi:hypothetical protein
MSCLCYANLNAVININDYYCKISTLKHDTRLGKIWLRNAGEIIMSSMEMTEDEYWDWVSIQYERLIPISKLRANIQDDAVFEQLGFQLLQSSHIIYLVE